MHLSNLSIRALATAVATLIVAGAMFALAGTSNANFRAAADAVEQRYAAQPVQDVIEPAVVDVARTHPREMTAAHVDERLRLPG